MTVQRLDDVAMDEVHLTMPVSDADIARLKLGDSLLKHLYDEVLAAEGLELRQIRVKYPRDSFFSKGERPANMAAVKHMSLNLIRQIDDKASLKVRRKTIGWDDHYLFAALTASNK